MQQTLVGNVPSVTTTLLQAPTTQFVTAIKPQQQEPQATITVPQQQQVFQTQQTAQVATTPAPQQNLIEVANTQQALLDQGQQAAQQLNRQYKEPEPLPQTSTNLVDRSNPLNDFLTNNQLQTTSSQQSNPQEVRREQQQNELANGISIDKIATTPQGYTQYLNLVLVDSRFYAARDIYTRQTNVDNQRLLRQLSSDKLHQQMVNQQYK